jgi:hypothetical protein
VRPALTIAVFALLVACLAPAAAFAGEDAADEPVAEQAAAEEVAAPVVKPPKLDDLGRVFPNPLLLQRSRRWIGTGALLSGGAGGLIATGIIVGSAMARGEIEIPKGGTFYVLSLFVGGASLGFVGLPLLSAGWFMQGQLLRTIKGAEKVPRTVANEAAYWSAYAARMYSQGMVVTGGGAVLLGILAVVAVGALVGTDVYDPGLWAGVVQPFGVGATLIVGSILLRKAADQRMDDVRNAVDPMRQGPDPLALLPVPTGSHLRRADGTDETRFGLAWSFAF